MKVFKNCKILIVIGCLANPTVSFASPTPFGFEVGKTRIEEINKKFEFDEIIENAYLGWNHWVKNSEKLKDEKYHSANFIVNEDGLLVGMILYGDKENFNKEIEFFKSKFNIVSIKTPKVGTKKAIFKDNNLNEAEVTVNYSKQGKIPQYIMEILIASPELIEEYNKGEKGQKK